MGKGSFFWSAKFESQDGYQDGRDPFKYIFLTLSTFNLWDKRCRKYLSMSMRHFCCCQHSPPTTATTKETEIPLWHVLILVGKTTIFEFGANDLFEKEDEGAPPSLFLSVSHTLISGTKLRKFFHMSKLNPMRLWGKKGLEMQCCHVFSFPKGELVEENF